MKFVVMSINTWTTPLTNMISNLRFGRLFKIKGFNTIILEINVQEYIQYLH